MTVATPIKTPLYLYNTLSRQKEIFVPLDEQKVSLYTCGPTVYNFAHIGNFRTYIFEDLLKRVLLFFGYQVHHVMNITDIDDKTIRGAIVEGIDLKAFTDPFTEAFFVDIAALNIVPASSYPKACDYISQMIDFVEKLIDRGYAYKSKDGSVYFAIDKFKNYGQLSHFKLDELQVCDRIASDEYDKENVGDFVLWKAHDRTRDGSIFWNSPFGPGRPGWHLECSTMAMHLLGETIDIHVGGVDNCFPHHENEIAQSEALSGKKFVNFWLHGEHLLVDNKKMSKSLGNFFTLRDLFERGYSGREVRYMLMHVHYRTQLNFTFNGLNGAKKALSHLDAFVLRLQGLANGEVTTAPSDQVASLLEKTRESFTNALADDLNISEALAALFNLLHEINNLYDLGGLSAADGSAVLGLVKQLDGVLGLFKGDERTSAEKAKAFPDEVLALLDKRNQARAAKNFAEADRLRNQILQQGYLVEDTPYGAKLKEKK